MFEFIIIFAMIIAIIINTIMAIFSFKYRKKKFALFLGLACFYGALVVLFYLLSISFNSKLTTSIFSSFYFICMDLMALSLFLFIYWLTESENTIIYKILISIVSIYGILDIIFFIVNIFNPKTPLHDGAVIISENKIKAAACMLPLSNDKSISKGLGTRHRSAAGMSQESDAIVVVVSEETGKISVAKDGTLIVDVKEDALRQILIKNIVTKKFGEEVPKKKLKEKINEIKEKTGKK